MSYVHHLLRDGGGATSGGKVEELVVRLVKGDTVSWSDVRNVAQQPGFK